jgi:hypothetical protein
MARSLGLGDATWALLILDKAVLVDDVDDDDDVDVGTEAAGDDVAACAKGCEESKLHAESVTTTSSTCRRK